MRVELLWTDCYVFVLYRLLVEWRMVMFFGKDGQDRIKDIL